MGALALPGLAQALLRQVQLSKDKLAVKSGKDSLTFQELHVKAMHLAHLISKRRLPLEAPIAILAPRGIDHVLAQVAVIYAGGSCTPLDVKQPDSYLSGLLSNLECGLVITDQDHQDRLSGYNHLLVDFRIGVESPNNTVDPRMVVGDKPTTRSHIFHTSGTTGKPKAVQILAKGLLNLAYNATYPVECGQRFAHAANVSFDVALYEIWMALLSGATSIIIPQHVVLDPMALSDYIRSETIESMMLTPALMTSTINAVPNAFATLHTLYSGGEAMNIQAIKTIFQNGAPKRVCNLYGPTETTCYALCHQVTRSDLEENQIPLGRAIANIGAHVVDDELKPVPPGQVGELLLQGECVSRGYFGGEANKASKAFIQVPQLDPQGLIYRTGDLVRVDAESGLYFFHGRKDNQVKIRGQRIELEAVELLLRQTGLVQDATVLKVQPEDDDGAGAILLAYVIRNNSSVDEAAVKCGYVGQSRLMVPRIEFIDEFPLRHTGKVDRKRLEQQYLAKMKKAKERCRANRQQTFGPGEDVSYAAVLEHLEMLWVETLNLPVAGLAPTDDFFAVGGTSLQAATLVARVRQMFAIELKSAALYEHPTLGELARVVELVRVVGKGEDGGLDDESKRQMEALWMGDCGLGKHLGPLDGATVIDWTARDEGRVLLTGATGFVGAFVLLELLRSPRVQRVACLVRARDSEAAWLRLLGNLAKYQMTLDTAMAERVLVVAGDFAQPLMGLATDHYELLAGWASVVFHLGAHVNYVQPYSSHRSANVIGTLHMLEFANHGRLKTLHYSSSPAAYGPVGFVLNAARMEEDQRPRDYMAALHYDSGYSQSQMVAETIVWNAIDNGLPATIFRPGFVLGHSRTGISNPDDFIGRLFASCLAVGSHPLLPAQRKEFVPVDFVVDAMLHIAADPRNLGHAYNLIPPVHSMDMNSAFALLARLAKLPMRSLPYFEWIRGFAIEESDPLHPLMPMLQEKVLGHRTRWELQENMVVYSTRNLCRALQDDAPQLLHCEPLSAIFQRHLPQWLPRVAHRPFSSLRSDATFYFC